MYFGEKFSHAIQKIPPKSDFKVQGGKITLTKATAKEQELGKQVLRAVKEISADYSEIDYARVDLVEFEGKWCVSEVEMLDPELFLLHKEGAVEAFCDIILRD